MRLHDRVDESSRYYPYRGRLCQLFLGPYDYWNFADDDVVAIRPVWNNYSSIRPKAHLLIGTLQHPP